MVDPQATMHTQLGGAQPHCLRQCWVKAWACQSWAWGRISKKSEQESPKLSSHGTLERDMVVAGPSQHGYNPATEGMGTTLVK